MTTQKILEYIENIRQRYKDNDALIYTKFDVLQLIDTFEAYVSALEVDMAIRAKYEEKRALETELDESFVVVQWKDGQRHETDHFFYEFPDNETLKDYAADCDGVTVEKLYRDLPFA